MDLINKKNEGQGRNHICPLSEQLSRMYLEEEHDVSWDPHLNIFSFVLLPIKFLPHLLLHLAVAPHTELQGGASETLAKHIPPFPMKPPRGAWRRGVPVEEMRLTPMSSPIADEIEYSVLSEKYREFRIFLFGNPGMQLWYGSEFPIESLAPYVSVGENCYPKPCTPASSQIVLMASCRAYLGVCSMQYPSKAFQILMWQ